MRAGSEAISIESSTDNIAVRVANGGGTVPGLLEGRMEVEEQLFLLLGNRRRHHQQQRLVHRASSSRVELERRIQIRGVTLGRVDDRSELIGIHEFARAVGIVGGTAGGDGAHVRARR